MVIFKDSNTLAYFPEKKFYEIVHRMNERQGDESESIRVKRGFLNNDGEGRTERRDKVNF